MIMCSFNTLTLSERAIIVSEYAHHLISIQYQYSEFHLLSIYSDLVEVCYNKLTRQVDNIRVIDYNGLDKYLYRIETNI